MRFIHTADWHLGRLLHNVHLTEDQAYVLDQFVDLVRQVRPHAVLVAGDVYDRAVPPVEAVGSARRYARPHRARPRRAGGASSPATTTAPTGWASAQSCSPERACTWSAPLGSGQTVVTVQHGAEALAVLPIPYAEPALVRERLGAPDVHDHAAAMDLLCRRARAAAPAGAPSVAVAHVTARRRTAPLSVAATP